VYINPLVSQFKWKRRLVQNSRVHFAKKLYEKNSLATLPCTRHGFVARLMFFEFPQAALPALVFGCMLIISLIRLTVRIKLKVQLAHATNPFSHAGVLRNHRTPNNTNGES
jgi:hypothetical protein